MQSTPVRDGIFRAGSAHPGPQEAPVIRCRKPVSTSLSLVGLAALLLTNALSGVTQTVAARPRLIGIDHVAFRVSDVDAARRFYGDVLGLPAQSRIGDTKIVHGIGMRQSVTLEPGLQADEDERLSHLAFGVVDVKAHAAYLRSRGVEVLQPIDRCQDEAIRVVDLDGHLIEFVPVSWPTQRAGPSRSSALSDRLLHAGLIIRDEQAAHRFYRDTLGFSEIWRGGRTEGLTQWVNMRVPEGTDYLEYMLVTAPPDRRQRGVLHHVCLMVPDIQEAWEEAVRRTAEPSRASMGPPQVGVNGRWQLNLFDPDGTRVELMEPFTIR
jgi:catechol 2,3-dioxygenase-like lactoylglutathione lyase family enzyme